MVPTRMTANGQSAQLASGRERIAIVRGLRTPFAKRGTAYADVSALELAKLVVTELLARAELDARENRPRGVRTGHSERRGAEHRSRDRSRHGHAQEHRGIQREPRLRHRLPSHDERGRGDAGGSRLGRGGRRRRQRERRSRPGPQAPRESAGRGDQGQTPARQARRAFEDFAPGLSPDDALGARAVDRPMDGGERRENGQGGGDRPRRARRVRPSQPRTRRQGVGVRRVRRRGDARLAPAHVRPRSGLRQRLATRIHTLRLCDARAGVRPEVRHDHRLRTRLRSPTGRARFFS